MGLAFDRTKFFNGTRGILGSLDQSQVDGLNEILDCVRADDKWFTDLRYVASFLGNVTIETAHHFKPIREFGGKTYFNQYEPGTPKGHALGNTEDGDGYFFRGAGYEQVTGRKNFTLAAQLCGIDCVTNPELLLIPKNSYTVCARFSIEGLFTGRRLTQYITAKTTDYLNSRRVINGLNRAGEISHLSKDFELTLKDALI